MRTIGYQVLLGLAVMTTLRLAHLRTLGRDVVGKFSAVIAPCNHNIQYMSD